MVVDARPDVVAAVLGRLRSFAELTALTSSRITSRLQPSWSGMPTYAVIVRTAGGPAYKPELPILMSRLDVFCYGATEAQSAALWRQLDAVFCPGQERSAGFTQGASRVYGVTLEAGPTTGPEPDTEWPRTQATYVIAWCGVAA